MNPSQRQLPGEAPGLGGGTATEATTSVVIPVSNEAEKLPHVFATIPHLIHEVVLDRIYGTRSTDFGYGFDAFWARYRDSLLGDCRGFEVETAMSTRAAEAGLLSFATEDER